jgi:hypothetical protein
MGFRGSPVQIRPSRFGKRKPGKHLRCRAFRISDGPSGHVLRMMLRARSRANPRGRMRRRRHQSRSPRQPAARLEPRQDPPRADTVIGKVRRFGRGDFIVAPVVPSGSAGALRMWSAAARPRPGSGRPPSPGWIGGAPWRTQFVAPVIGRRPVTACSRRRLLFGLLPLRARLRPRSVS